MQSVLVHGEISPDDLRGVIDAAGVEYQSGAAYAFGTTRVVFLLGRKHFFRSNSYLGVCLVAATDGTTQRIDIGQAGGGAGLMGVEWGAGDDLEANVYNSLAAVINARGLSAEPQGP
jgi:hypothetical protein